jgi:hypothetical protein
LNDTSDGSQLFRDGALMHIRDLAKFVLPTHGHALGDGNGQLVQPFARAPFTTHFSSQPPQGDACYRASFISRGCSERGSDLFPILFQFHAGHDRFTV